jgi:hypothetical protein
MPKMAPAGGRPGSSCGHAVVTNDAAAPVTSQHHSAHRPRKVDVPSPGDTSFENYKTAALPTELRRPALQLRLRR